MPANKPNLADEFRKRKLLKPAKLSPRCSLVRDSGTRLPHTHCWLYHEPIAYQDFVTNWRFA